MKKIMLVFGTRPEAIKMAPLIKEFQKHPHLFQTVVCVTGQHREMLDQVLRIFDIHPDYDLNIMKQGQDLYDVTARVLTGMRDVLKEFRPDLVLVHGDTTTSTAAALAAFYQQIPVGHIEAGLRTHNMAGPQKEKRNEAERKYADAVERNIAAGTIDRELIVGTDGVTVKSSMTMEGPGGRFFPSVWRGKQELRADKWEPVSFLRTCRKAENIWQIVRTGMG